MKIKSIIVIPKHQLKNTLIGWIIMPLLLLLVIVVVPISFIYDFIKRKIFKIKDEEPVEYVLFENEEFRIEGDYIYPVDRAELPMIDRFCEEADCPHSEEIIFQAQDKKKPSELGGGYFTEFLIDTEHHLYLQKIAQEDDKVNTFLISFEKKTGKVEVVKEIGQYILEYYDEQTNTIRGFGKNDIIKIELE